MRLRIGLKKVRILQKLNFFLLYFCFVIFFLCFMLFVLFIFCVEYVCVTNLIVCIVIEFFNKKNFLLCICILVF